MSMNRKISAKYRWCIYSACALLVFIGSWYCNSVESSFAQYQCMLVDPRGQVLSDSLYLILDYNNRKLDTFCLNGRFQFAPVSTGNARILVKTVTQKTFLFDTTIQIQAGNHLLHFTILDYFGSH